jgi:hypothetical protein
MNPEFEDEKIRRWREPTEGREWLQDDPTVMSIDIKTEEVFESRAYALAEGARSRLLDLAAREGISSSDALEFAGEFSFKFLAKRRRDDGLITYLLTFVGPDERHLLSREDWVTEEHYRQAVREFEAAVTPEGLAEPPIVVTLAEWRQIEQETGSAGNAE